MNAAVEARAAFTGTLKRTAPNNDKGTAKRPSACGEEPLEPMPGPGRMRYLRAPKAPLLFDDHDPAGAQRSSIVAPANTSPSAQNKARSKHTEDGLPVHSFRSLLDDLATIVQNRVVPRLPGAQPFDLLTRPTPLQRQAFKLLDVQLQRSQ